MNELSITLSCGCGEWRSAGHTAGHRATNWRLSCVQVLTKDSVTVSVDAVVYYRVSNATISIANVENAHHSTRLLAQTTLRNTLGMRPLHEILSDRDTISSSMQVTLDEATDAWGIKVERVEMWVFNILVFKRKYIFLTRLENVPIFFFKTSLLSFTVSKSGVTKTINKI